MADVFFQTGRLIRRLAPELRKLTLEDPKSDMNRLLDSLKKGENPLVLSTVAVEAGAPVGWATCEHFKTSRRHHYLVNVFVSPAFRGRGLARRLLNELLGEVGRRYPTMECEAGDSGDSFWSRFPVKPVVDDFAMGPPLNRAPVAKW